MWQLYDQLIESVSEEISEDVLVGLSWTAVRSKTIGLAFSETRTFDNTPLAGHMKGKRVKELAAFIKSWDLVEAGVGLAAINSCINTRTSIETLSDKGLFELQDISAFEYMLEIAAGKKVAVIGHFSEMENLQKNCTVTILERQPQSGDYLDTAAEYLLPEQDVVLITSSTLINKTTPRLLELSRNAITVLLGPSTPLSSVMFDFGVDVLGGLVVENPGYVFRCVSEGGGMENFRQSVRFVNIARKD